jgi:hypothetical protein
MLRNQVQDVIWPHSARVRASAFIITTSYKPFLMCCLGLRSLVQLPSFLDHFVMLLLLKLNLFFF